MAAQVEIFVQPGTRKRPSNGLECADGTQGRDFDAGPVVTREVARVGS